MKAFTFVTFAAAAGLASAQSLSEGCTNSLKAVLNDPAAECLNTASLLSFFVGNAQSVPTTIDNWLTGLCSSGFCSNATLAAVVTNITTGCATDLSSVGVSGVPETVTQIVQEVYPTVRNVMCLKDDASNKLCVTETLQSLEDIVGKMTVADLNIATLVADFQKLVAGAANLACTNCTKAAISLASPIISSIPDFPLAVQGIDALCGAGFIDGSSSDMAGVSQTANTEAFAQPKSGAALGLTTSKTAGAVMVLLFSAFTLLG
ncbi:hypothetical protein B0H17DRAFT_1041504 [Mycena rosella]|uniref:DUF7729 domain-containing protein n=1 Tax=Mycena rosella TaxID=1033263 RepID=A0AAD7GNB1_MYCRO|nr:hypothetical protein B0H17DRAFT_1041504 [Mycena rosella]